MAGKVYFAEVKDSSDEDLVSRRTKALLARADILGVLEEGSYVGIKIHFGEHGNKGHVKPSWAKTVVRNLNEKTHKVFLTDSNVLYKTSLRTNAIDHIKTALAHGFTLEGAGAPVVIADGLLGEEYKTIEIGKNHFSGVKIARAITECDYLVCLTHVTGHMQTSFAGALKNLGMGCASRQGKYEQHSASIPQTAPAFCTGCGMCVSACGASAISIQKGKARISKDKCIGCGQCVVVCRTNALNTAWCETLENLQEKMVEYAYGVIRALKGKVFYMNYLTHITKNCDCLAKDERPKIDDLGIAASFDPVAVDKASLDIVNASYGKDFFKDMNSGTDWAAQLGYAEEIGLGSMEYRLERMTQDA